VILGIDTDVLTAWAMRGHPRHFSARRLFQEETQRQEKLLGVAPQILQEFLHVASDPRRFENPLPFQEAIRVARSLWNAREVARIVPSLDVLPRTLDLMAEFDLGRKRILDTAFAATLEAAGVRRLATFNPGDFAIFPFLDLVEIPSGST
jgi:predicted nucleic acid-binding protein